jgi:hypothetical protein
MTMWDEFIREGKELIPEVGYADVRNALNANTRFTYQMAEQTKNIIAEAGDNNTEIVAQRTDAYGRTYKTSGDRADAEQIKVNDALKQKAEKGNITLEDLTTQVKEAMTGGSVPVVGVNSVGQENVKRSGISPINIQGLNVINFLNPDTATIGKKMFTGSATGDNASYAITDFVRVGKGDTFTILDNKDDVVANLYNSNREWSSAITGITVENGFKTFSVSDGEAFWMKVNILIQSKPIGQQMLVHGDVYPDEFKPYLLTSPPSWLDLTKYDNLTEFIETQTKLLFHTTSKPTLLAKDEITFEMGAYGYQNLIRNPSEPIKQIRKYERVDAVGVEYRCRIRDSSYRVLHTVTVTPTGTGYQWLEFDFNLNELITGSNIFIDITSLNKVLYMQNDTPLSDDATASNSLGNRHCTNSNLESFSPLSPANGYYMLFELQSSDKLIAPPVESVGINQLTNELRGAIGVSEKQDADIFMPKKVFTWADGIVGDFIGERVPRVGIYLDHAIPWGTDVTDMKFQGENQKNRIDLISPYPLDWSIQNVNDGVNKKEITVNYHIIGKTINDVRGSFVQVSVRNDVGESEFVSLLVIGDSTVEGANAFITLEDGTQVWAPFWHEVARQFAMDSIESDDITKYKFASLGTRTGKGGADTVNYLGKTRNITTATGGESGSKLADHLRYVSQKRPSQETWDLLGLGDGSGTDFKGTAAQKDLIAQTPEVYTGTEESYTGNPFFDPDKTGNNRFSIAKWLERYRTMDDNGNRLTLGNGTGSKITADNLNTINVCAPTHVVLQTGLNDWSQVSVEQYLADMDIFANEVKSQLPSASIAITLFADDPGTYFKELYPEIVDSDMRHLHDKTRSYITALQDHFGDSTDVTLLPFHFVMPPAVSISYRWIQNDDGRKVKAPFGPASNDYHANGYAHRAWANQLYAWIKSTFV